MITSDFRCSPVKAKHYKGQGVLHHFDVEECTDGSSSLKFKFAGLGTQLAVVEGLREGILEYVIRLRERRRESIQEVNRKQHSFQKIIDIETKGNSVLRKNKQPNLGMSGFPLD